MGHQHLGVLPQTRRWKHVVQLISGGADVSEVSAATSAAAETQMVDASNDPAFRQSLWLLTQIPLAAREDDFAAALRAIGLEISASATVAQIATAMSAAVDRKVTETGGRTDLGEMAQLCAVESLYATAGRDLADLFGTTPDRSQDAFRRLGTVKGFARLAREFFSRLMRRILCYYLSRELSQHVGVNSRFQTVREHLEFEDALDRHCHEASRILKEYSGQWYSKAVYAGNIDQAKVGRFADYAFEKLHAELRLRRGVNA